MFATPFFTKPPLGIRPASTCLLPDRGRFHTVFLPASQFRDGPGLRVVVGPSMRARPTGQGFRAAIVGQYLARVAT